MSLMPTPNRTPIPTLTPIDSDDDDSDDDDSDDDARRQSPRTQTFGPNKLKKLPRFSPKAR